MAEVLNGRRIVADPASLDTAEWPVGSVVLRIAPDDVLVLGEGAIALSDQHAIVEPDGGFCGVRMTELEVIRLLSRNANWHLPDVRPCLAQGMVAGLPVKVLVDDGRALLITLTPFAAELEEQLL